MGGSSTLQRDSQRKVRGAFYTPGPIADFLANWAVCSGDARVLDPTCGNGIFLRAAARRLLELDPEVDLTSQVTGVDIYGPALAEARTLLDSNGLAAALNEANFFQLPAPGDSFSTIPAVDAVVGNPPFVRFQEHAGTARAASRAAALRQGVRLSGLASSWAALLVHASAFLKPTGRLAMVLPAELLTVSYAEPLRQWLRKRFAAVKLVFFERLQFDEALENVVLLLAQGKGGCDAFSLYYVSDAAELESIQAFDEIAVTTSPSGKWTDMLLSIQERQLFKSVLSEHFVRLQDYGSTVLGTVTGSNNYFTLNEETRIKYQLEPLKHVYPISPPGTKHIKGLSFRKSDWQSLKDQGERVWLFYPRSTDDLESHCGLSKYITIGEHLGVPEAYKCRIRTPWWRPPLVSPPDLFFTYMSHRYPRLITNQADMAFVNSMHGVRLSADVPRAARDALPLLAMNSVTFLGAELFGRSYGGGVLKMEPREASELPMPRAQDLLAAWSVLRPERSSLERQLRNGRWTNVVARVDQVLLGSVLGLGHDRVAVLHGAAKALRSRRLARGG